MAFHGCRQFSLQKRERGGGTSSMKFEWIGDARRNCVLHHAVKNNVEITHKNYSMNLRFFMSCVQSILYSILNSQL